MCWIFDRGERLGDLAARADRRAAVLRRELFDLPRGSAARAAMLRRIDLVEDRRDRLRTIARAVRSDLRRLALQP